MIVIPEIDAVTPLSIWNTRLAPPAFTVTPAAGPVIVVGTGCVAEPELAQRQRDRLGAGENGRVEGDHLVRDGVGARDRFAKAGGTGIETEYRRRWC